MARRPGFQPLSQLDQDVRTALEPLTDVVARMSGSSIPKLANTNILNLPYLTATATLADVIDRVNLLLFTLNNAITDQNAVKARLQED